MPRRYRATLSKKNGGESARLAFKDFSVYDYPHSGKDGSTQNTLRTSTTLTRESKALMNEQDWFDKDLSDFDETPDDELALEAREHEERASIAKRLQSHSGRRQVRRAAFEDDDNGERRDYPLDLWFLIARHIAPEDVRKFALLCRASNHVVNTVIFWMRLFYRHNKKEAAKLNRVLVHEHVSIVRTHVIKSLFQVYPIFQQRNDKTAIIQKDPHFLVRARCVRLWSSKNPTPTTPLPQGATPPRSSYNYYFEFRFDSPLHERKNEIKARIEPQSPLLRTTQASTIDKNSCILHLTCSNYIPIGPFMGMILHNVALTMSSDYHYQKLKLLFSSRAPCIGSTMSKTDATSEVIIDPLLSLKVYTWYNSPASFD